MSAVNGEDTSSGSAPANIGQMSKSTAASDNQQCFDQNPF